MKKKLFILFQYLIPQHGLSWLAGRLANCEQRWLKSFLVKRFINHFKVDLSEALIENPDAFKTFNEFFTRALKPDARPVDSNPKAIISPADGAISEIGRIEHGRILQAKGRGYGLTTLLGGNPDLASHFINGQFATIYLAPRDYHRVHMPMNARLTESIYVPGDLFSVNQTTADSVDNLFARNERLVSIFETEQGPIAMIMVGALIVSGIETVWSGTLSNLSKGPHILRTEQPPQQHNFARGDEYGRFHLGSTVILLLPPGMGEWDPTLQAGSKLRMGQAIGSQV